MPLFCLGFLLSLPWSSYAGAPTSPLSIQPEEPLVERGGSVRLTCSLDCPGGKVRWRGLDTDLGNVAYSHNHSVVLTVHNATVGAEGEKSCVGQCRRKPYQKKVELRVYSFPDTMRLESQPARLRAGGAARLTCSVSHVYPPGSLTLRWFRGGEPLGAYPTEEEEEEEEEAAEEGGGARDPLFAYRSVLEVPAAEAGTAYKCQAVLRVGRQSFRKEKMAGVGGHDAQATAGATEKTTVASGRTSPVATSKPLTPARWIPSFTATSANPLPSTGAASGGTTTGPPASASVAGTGTPPVEMSSPPRSPPLAKSPVAEAWTVLPTPEAEAPSSSPPALTHSSTAAPTTSQVPASSILTVVSTSRGGGGCRAVVKSEPSPGSIGRPLRITCHVPECGAHVRIRWVETPAPQAQYRREEADGRSTLSVDSAGVEHQGLYRCLPSSSHTRTGGLWVNVSEDKFHVDSVVAAGTVGCLFGLVVTGYVLHRTWRKRAS